MVGHVDHLECSSVSRLHELVQQEMVRTLKWVADVDIMIRHAHARLSNLMNKLRMQLLEEALLSHHQ